MTQRERILSELLNELQAWGHHVLTAAVELEHLAENAERIAGESPDYTLEGYTANSLRCRTFYPVDLEKLLVFLLNEPEQIEAEIRELAAEDALAGSGAFS